MNSRFKTIKSMVNISYTGAWMEAITRSHTRSVCQTKTGKATEIVRDQLAMS